jgi:hypothetical protein
MESFGIVALVAIAVAVWMGLLVWLWRGEAGTEG